MLFFWHTHLLQLLERILAYPMLFEIDFGRSDHPFDDFGVDVTLLRVC